MPISIAVKMRPADKIRHLAEQHPYLSADDIAQLGGFQPNQVREALQNSRRDKPKLRVR